MSVADCPELIAQGTYQPLGNGCVVNVVDPILQDSNTIVGSFKGNAFSANYFSRKHRYTEKKFIATIRSVFQEQGAPIESYMIGNKEGNNTDYFMYVRNEKTGITDAVLAILEDKSGGDVYVVTLSYYPRKEDHADRKAIEDLVDSIQVP